MVLAARALAKDAQAVALDVDGEKTQGRALPHLRASATCSSRCKVTNTGEATVQAVVTVIGRADHAGAGRGQAASRSSATTTRSTASRPIRPRCKQNDRFAVVLQDHRAAAAVRPHHRRRLSAGGLRDRQSAARLLGRYRHAGLDRGCAGAGERRIPRRPLQRGVRRARAASRRCSRSPMSCARCRPAATSIRRPMSRTCTGPTASAAPPPARSRSRRRSDGA